MLLRGDNMKQKFVIVLLVMAIVLCYGCAGQSSTSYLRIHIRANSNSATDQAIKYEVKDLVVTYLTPYVSDCDSLDEVKQVVNNCKLKLKQIVDTYLQDNNFDYECSININNEFFPTRRYDGVTLEANYYDAVIVNLGSGQGNNWWCVVYPPLCFTGNNVVYKSKLVELIQKYLS